MKAHLTKVSLALLSAVFLLGCQEQGSEPVGPEGLEIQAKRGNDKGKGDGSSTLAELTISEGMTTPGVQLVAFWDSKNEFKIQAHDNAIGDRIFLVMNLDMNLNLEDCAEAGPDKGDYQALFDKLNDVNDAPSLPRRQLFITVGKDEENNPDDHKIAIFWDEDDSSFRMELRPNTVVTDEKVGGTPPLKFTFTGGTVELRDVTERRPKDRIKVTCDLDPLLKIVMDLTPA